MIWANGKITKLGIADSIFRGMLDGPEDLFSRECMIYSISSLETWAIVRLIWLRFFKNLDGDILGTFGIKSSVFAPTFAKKLLKFWAISLFL